MIQDYIFFSIGVLFSLCLIPTIINVFKTKYVNNLSWISLIVTSFGLYIYCVTMITIHCYFTGIINFINASCWLILLILKIIYRNNNG
jgi:uncharacterized protein with PQ loop repeat